MPYRIDIGPWWPFNELEQADHPVNSVYEFLIQERRKVNIKTLRLAKQGQLRRCSIDVLKNLQYFCSQQAGREVAIEEMIRDDAEDPDDETGQFNLF